MKTNKNATRNVIWPSYKFDERLMVDREVDIPPANMFFELGYNRTKEDKIKHYRRFYTNELELVEEVMPGGSPFMREPAYRMEQESAGLFGGGDNDSENNKSVVSGYFKGLVAMYNEERKAKREVKMLEGVAGVKLKLAEIYELQLGKKFDFDYECLVCSSPAEHYRRLKNMCYECGVGSLKIDEYLANFAYTRNLQKRLNETVKAKARIYVLEGFNFAQRDLFSPSDPFLILKCGNDVYNERENYQLDCSDPKFFKVYEFNVGFPGSPVMSIEAYDYDAFFGDDLIGISKLDLDDRFFNKEWCAIENKPIEYRDLFHPTSTVTQGVIKCWVELYSMSNKNSNTPVIDITPEPEKEYEMRFIIWKTKDIEMMDFEGTSDVYCRTFLDPDEDHLTDTHWRNQNGKASFNWRNLIKIKSKQDQYLLNIQCWDKDIFASDEIIGSFSLDVWPIFEDCILTDKLQTFSSDYWNSYMKNQLIERGYEFADKIEFEKEDKELFWVPMYRFNEEEGKDKISGYVQCSFRIYPKASAEKNKQGVGRDEPNNDPVLPEPEGRLQLSLNPFTMFMQLVGPGVRRKIYMCICLIAYLALCSFMAPMIISNGFSKLLFG